MGLYFPLFNFTIVFTRTVGYLYRIMNEPKKLNHFKIFLSHVDSEIERSGAPFLWRPLRIERSRFNSYPRHVVVPLNKVLQDICRCLVD